MSARTAGMLAAQNLGATILLLSACSRLGEPTVSAVSNESIAANEPPAESWNIIDPGGRDAPVPEWYTSHAVRIDSSIQSQSSFTDWQSLDPQLKELLLSGDAVPVDYEDPAFAGPFLYGLISNLPSLKTEEFAAPRAISMTELGYFTETGRLLFKLAAQNANTFSEGLAGVQERSSGSFGFVDQLGVMRITPRFVSVGFFSEDLAAVGSSTLTPRKYGYIDSSGNEVIEPRYFFAGKFVDGLAPVLAPYGTNHSIAGFIDKTGELVLKPLRAVLVREFSEGLAGVEQFDPEGNPSWGFIDREGKIVVPAVFQDVGLFSNGLAPAKLNNRWGYIDRSGSFIIEPIYQNASNFYRGVAAVQN